MLRKKRQYNSNSIAECAKWRSSYQKHLQVFNTFNWLDNNVVFSPRASLMFHNTFLQANYRLATTGGGGEIIDANKLEFWSILKGRDTWWQVVTSTSDDLIVIVVTFVPVVPVTCCTYCTVDLKTLTISIDDSVGHNIS